MRVEKAARCSILDLTWAQVKSILNNWRMHHRLEAGLGLDHSDMIRLQKLADGLNPAPTNATPPPAEPQKTFG